MSVRTTKLLNLNGAVHLSYKSNNVTRVGRGTSVCGPRRSKRVWDASIHAKCMTMRLCYNERTACVRAAKPNRLANICSDNWCTSLAWSTQEWWDQSERRTGTTSGNRLSVCLRRNLMTVTHVNYISSDVRTMVNSFLNFVTRRSRRQADKL